MRIDKYIFEKGDAPSRQKAREMIEAGFVTVGDRQVTKPSFEVDPDNDFVKVLGRPYEYVGRGGVKLESALKGFKIDPKGLVAADIGSSTGGFTDCLLRYGAKKVFAIDSGRDQLHKSLRADSRVVVMEGFNARELGEAALGEKVDITVCDVSFISQKYIYPSVTAILKEDGIFVSLIKPQFEAGREHLNKKGIVKDIKIHKRVIESCISEAARLGLACKGVISSPISGGDGNVEYLAMFRYTSDKSELRIGDVMPNGL